MDDEKKDLAMKILVWSVPVIFGAGALVQEVSEDTSNIGALQSKVEAHERALADHSSLSGHAVTQTQIEHLTGQQDKMITEQREMRAEQRAIAVDLAAICQATGANCGNH